MLEKRRQARVRLHLAVLLSGIQLPIESARHDQDRIIICFLFDDHCRVLLESSCQARMNLLLIAEKNHSPPR